MIIIDLKLKKKTIQPFISSMGFVNTFPLFS